MDEAVVGVAVAGSDRKRVCHRSSVAQQVRVGQAFLVVASTVDMGVASGREVHRDSYRVGDTRKEDKRRCVRFVTRVNMGPHIGQTQAEHCEAARSSLPRHCIRLEQIPGQEVDRRSGRSSNTFIRSNRTAQTKT